MADGLPTDPAQSQTPQAGESADRANGRPEREREEQRIPLPQCPVCGYLLVGLADAGVCPECGQPYNAETARLTLPRRPVLGYAYLLVPAASLLIFEFFMYFTLGVFGYITIPCFFIVMLFWALPVSDNVAAWHCGRTHWKFLAHPPTPSLDKRIFRMRRWLFLAQLLALMATIPLFHWIMFLLEKMSIKTGWS